MVKIVDQAIKIDLHIHSKKSYFKDKAIVENSDINNIKTLIASNLILNTQGLFRNEASLFLLEKTKNR